MNDISSSTGYVLNGKHFPPGATYKLGDKRVGSRMIVLRDGDEIQVPGTPQGTFFMMRFDLGAREQQTMEADY